MDLSPPRGTQDFLPPESDRLLALYDAAHRAASSFGYRYVETPTFETTDLFARSSGETSDVVSKEMYTFTDRGGRSVTLRPEGTAAVVRAYLSHAHDLPTPFKGYYVETLFRYGRPQKGRRPSWADAALPDAAEPAVEAFARALEATGVHIGRGVFGAHMRVELVNDGPVTIVLDG